MIFQRRPLPYMYYLLSVLVYLISLLPLTLLYLLSDLGYGLVYYLLSYRKKVVRQNLSTAFPHKSLEELRRIEKQFYRSFCDQWVETIKLRSLSTEQLLERMPGNWEQLNLAVSEGNGRLVVMMGHQFNWEWGNLVSPLKFLGWYAGIYKPQGAKAFDLLMRKIRSRTGGHLIPSKQLKEGFKALANRDFLLAFIADQSPASHPSLWLSFLNQPTAFLTGPEKVARLQRAAVVFVSLRRPRRGHYEFYAQRYCLNARTEEDGAITRAYAQFLEQELNQFPENWLWSHKRWKIQPPGGRISKKKV